MNNITDLELEKKHVFHLNDVKLINGCLNYSIIIAEITPMLREKFLSWTHNNNYVIVEGKIPSNIWEDFLETL